MRQFSLTQLLMGVLFVAIVLCFSQTEGFDVRFSAIESLSFSSNDSRIAVAKLDARRAGDLFKMYKADVSRTVSWLDGPTGDHAGLIRQDLKAGNCGPAGHLWRLGRTTVLCDPSSDQVVMTEFGGGDLIRFQGTNLPSVTRLQHKAERICYSRSGRLLAAVGEGRLTVFDTQNNTVKMQAPLIDMDWYGGKMSFTDDESRIILVADSGLCLWDVSSPVHRSYAIQGLDQPVDAIEITPDDHLVVCTRAWVRRYDLCGCYLDSFSDEGAHACALSREGNRLAICTNQKITVYDLSSNSIASSWLFRAASALALSSTGDSLAVGDRGGRVTLFDTSTGFRRWDAIPSGANRRYRLPWTFAAALLIAWTAVAWRLLRPSTY